MQAQFQNFKLKSSYKGTKCAPWNKGNFNNHMIKVTNVDTGQSCTFEFWASIAQPETKTEYDLLNAFYCFVADCASALDTFEDFCSNYGYDTDSRQAERIYKACEKSRQKFIRIASDDPTILWELYNDLSEDYA